MINSISLNNIVICKDSEINLASGFTALTGETGAGKSIIIDALEISLGKKANYDLIMHGADKLSVVVSFDITNNNEAKKLLEEQQIDFDNEIVIKRVLRKEKKSIALVQGERVSLSFLSKLGSVLVNIHDQNSHIKLSNKEYNLRMFDRAVPYDLLVNVEDAYLNHSEIKTKLDEMETLIASKKQNMELNKYYKAELDELSPSADEYKKLLEMKKEFSSRESNVENLTKASRTLEGETSVSTILDSAVQSLSLVDGLNDKIHPIIEMLTESSINISEAISDLSRIELSNEEVDIDDIVGRISTYQKLSSKHSCQPDELESLLVTLAEKTESFEDDEIKLEELTLELSKALAKYNNEAQILHEARLDIASKISESISEMLPQLSLEHSRFKLDYRVAERVSRYGFSDCSMLFSANKGQEMNELATVASGGELSRIALCIQVCLSRMSRLPTLIFDEVDVGISGNAALVVGRIFKEIGKSVQVMTITHQSQVAAAADSHILVEKIHGENATYNQIRHLNEEEVISEVKRLLVGYESEQSTSLARDLVNQFKDVA